MPDEGSAAPPTTSASRDGWVIGLDADDTLWENEEMFADGEQLLRELLAPWADGETTDQRLLAKERDTLPIYGYGVKGFVLSMIETAIELSHGAIGNDALGRIIAHGRFILEAPPVLLAGVAETVTVLAERWPLLLLTKGDHHHQRRKINASGLVPELIGAEVLDEKDPPTYAAVLRRHDVDPTRFLMVGNSVRSDVQPVLDLGGAAIHIPYHLTWAHEVVGRDAAHPDADRMATCERFDELPDRIPALIAAVESAR